MDIAGQSYVAGMWDTVLQDSSSGVTMKDGEKLQEGGTLKGHSTPS
jgi:hypothetical protein